MYNNTPSQEIFDEMKQIATEVWKTYDNQFWYVDEKLEVINSLENVSDNAMIFYRMFDWPNQDKFISKINNPEIKPYLINNM